MTKGSSPPRRRSPGGPIIGWRFSVALVMAAVLGSTAVATAILLVLVSPTSPGDRLDVIRTVLAVAAGSGALITLLYAIRRQLLAEQIALDTKRDATEKRITEIYVKGIEQFSATAIQARYGGLYALERLGTDEERLRETIVEVLCAYLRTTSNESEDDQDLRRSIQIVLMDHLASNSKYSIHKDHWREVRGMILSRAHLNGYFRALTIDTAHFSDCTFTQAAEFHDAVIRGANFASATFCRGAEFNGAKLTKAIFTAAQFNGDAIFDDVRFGRQVDYTGASFSGSVSFSGATVQLDESDFIILPPGWRVRPDLPENGDSGSTSGKFGYIEQVS